MNIRMSKRMTIVGLGVVIVTVLIIMGSLIARLIWTPLAAPERTLGSPNEVAEPSATIWPSAEGAISTLEAITQLPTTSAPPTATVTSTFPSLPSTQMTVPATYAPTALPPATVIDQTGAGTGISESFELPEGLYRVIFISGGPVDTVIPAIEEGACSIYPLFSGISGPFEGSASYRSTGCHVHFEISGANGAWSIRVETVTVGGILTIPQEFTGNNPVTTSQVDMPEGQYHLVLETDSIYTLVVPVIIQGLCLERPVFVTTQPGHYEADYASTGCVVVWQIANVDKLWSLSITSKSG